jgi:hypothetical protein
MRKCSKSRDLIHLKTRKHSSHHNKDLAFTQCECVNYFAYRDPLIQAVEWPESDIYFHCKAGHLFVPLCRTKETYQQQI